ncbi:MAG: hypothetical protein WC441_00915 [Patescibacteria group bacterium]
MLTRNKSKALVFFLAFLLTGLFLARPASALSPAIRQVKTPDNPGVYYLNHASQTKKLYLNEAAYLSYGNHWSDVKVISQEELNRWANAVLVKSEASPDIYYIRGGQKALIASSSDLLSFNLSKEPIITVSQIDLDQYILASYSDLGLVANNPNPNFSNQPVAPVLASSTLEISFDKVTNNTNNNILAGTNSNLIGVLNLKAGANDVAIKTLKVDVTGVYENSLIDKVYITLEDYKMVERYSHFHDRQLEVNFPDDPYLISANNTRTVRVWVNLKPCTTNCGNQSLRTEIKSAANIDSNASVSASLPLVSNYLGIISVPNLLGQAKIEEQSIASNTSGINMVLGKYLLSEESGQEEVYLKELVLTNQGSAGTRDLQSFRLQQGDTIISRVSTMSDNKIVFKVNYCRISKDKPVTLMVFGQKSPDFNSGQTLNLDVSSAWLVGKNIGVSLNPVINNLNETKIIN